MTAEIVIEPGDLDRTDVQALLVEHLAEMRATSPACSMHALDLEGLRRPEVTLWTAVDGGRTIGCAALQELDATHAEIKSMRVVDGARGRGLGTLLLQHLLAEARRRGYRRLSLETGSQPAFAPARLLYLRHGFTESEPFGDYLPDPDSVFMTRRL